MKLKNRISKKRRPIHVARCYLMVCWKTIQKSYDEQFNDLVIDIVLIENQLSPVAIRMKSLQGMISQYFIMNNINIVVNIYVYE